MSLASRVVWFHSCFKEIFKVIPWSLQWKHTNTTLLQPLYDICLVKICIHPSLDTKKFGSSLPTKFHSCFLCLLILIRKNPRIHSITFIDLNYYQLIHQIIVKGEVRGEWNRRGWIVMKFSINGNVFAFYLGRDRLSFNERKTCRSRWTRDGGIMCNVCTPIYLIPSGETE